MICRDVVRPASDIRGDHPLHVGPLGYNGSKVPWELQRSPTHWLGWLMVSTCFNLFSILKDGMIISEIPYFDYFWESIFWNRVIFISSGWSPQFLLAHDILAFCWSVNLMLVRPLWRWSPKQMWCWRWAPGGAVYLKNCLIWFRICNI